MLIKVGVRCITVKWASAQRIANSHFHLKIPTAPAKESSEVAPGLEFMSKYDNQTVDRILTVLNSTCPSNLTRYDISKGCSQQIQKYRTKKGPFTSIKQLLDVENFDKKYLEKLLSSIAEEPIDKTRSLDKQLKKVLQNITLNALTKEKRSKIKTVTSIHVGLTHVSWTKMDIDGHLLVWDACDFPEWPKQINTNLFHNVALEVWSKLPVSDVYVAEDVTPLANFQNKIDSKTMLRNIQRFQLAMTLQMLISTKFNQSDGNEGPSYTQIDNHYFIRPNIPPKLFQLIIGRETVSADSLVQTIIDDNISKSLSHILPVIIDPFEASLYNGSNKFRKEGLSQALLTAVAFIDLVILCNPVSLKSLTSNQYSTKIK
ncbi:transcription elongation factor, mitochondrial isoform X1 [Neodiprion lecontei]|uniref:Transcription elongation factor, mitochondrial isoform X1 n=1 Tax=Neodiprion lecontei TaxID=441921 RepID=A0A6J0B9P8_NEOLC|nr:transcription elongation factor, mitochondrial isoform X1 [Neodiprion lecontei]